jgi:hypothetical protein
LLPYAAQDLSQNLSSTPTATSTPMMVVVVVAVVTVAFTLDHPEQPLRLME